MKEWMLTPVEKREILTCLRTYMRLHTLSAPLLSLQTIYRIIPQMSLAGALSLFIFIAGVKIGQVTDQSQPGDALFPVKGFLRQWGTMEGEVLSSQMHQSFPQQEEKQSLVVQQTLLLSSKSGSLVTGSSSSVTYLGTFVLIGTSSSSGSGTFLFLRGSGVSAITILQHDGGCLHFPTIASGSQTLIQKSVLCFKIKERQVQSRHLGESL